MNFKSIFAISFLLLAANKSFATDLEQVVSGAEVEDALGKQTTTGVSPYIIESTPGKEVENQVIKENAEPDILFDEHTKEVTVKDSPKKKYEDFGYTVPGAYEKSESFLENDKGAMAKDFRKHSSGGLNLTFIKDDFSYESNNDIINRTIGEGYKHVKGGILHLRSDQYFFRRDYVNTFWSVGAGVGYNSGRGIFVNGERSNTTFKLWETPVDLSLGFEVPIYHWFKVSASAGPSAMALYQNRNDFQKGEKGRNKIQASYGQFANAQFKVNLSGFSDETAYELFTNSKITNLYLNLDVRYQNYQNFLDDIKISGTSFGIGFTFEYL